MTDDQIVIVQEITLESDFTFVSALVDGLNAAQEARLLTKVTEWETNNYGEKEGDMLPNKEDVLFNQLGRVRKIRFNVRLMLGLPAVSDTELEIAELTGTYGSNTAGKGGGGSGGSDSMDFGVFRSTGTAGIDEFSPV